MTDGLAPKAEAKPSKSPRVDVDQVRAAAALDFCLAEDCYDVRELRMVLAAMTGRVYGLANMVDVRESAYERGFAAGRVQAASDVRGYAESLRSTSWNAHTGVALGAVVDAAARIAEGSTEGDEPTGAVVDEPTLPASTGGGIHGETPTGGTR